MPEGTEVEVAVYEEVEPKRTLVVPEGVEFIEDEGPGRLRGAFIVCSKKTIGWFTRVQSPNNALLWNDTGLTSRVMAKLEEDIEQAAYRELANLGWHRFGWKTEEPDWSRYESFTVFASGYVTQEFPKYQQAIHEGKCFFRRYNSVRAVFVHGWTADGQVDLLETLTKKSEESDGVSVTNRQ
jgi:hypothetical protein